MENTNFRIFVKSQKECRLVDEPAIFIGPVTNKQH